MKVSRQSWKESAQRNCVRLAVEARCFVPVDDYAGRWSLAGESLGRPLLQYESAGKRACAELGIPDSVTDDLVDMLCARGCHNVVRFRWRGALPDPNDHFVLELAVAAGCKFIVTYNTRDFSGTRG